MSDFDAMDEILREFLVESYENLDSLDSDLVVLEGEPDSAETLGKVFRTIHTIKGTSGVLGFAKLERVTHVGENLLVRMRDGELSFDQAIATGLLQMVDAVREMLARIEADGADGEEDYGTLVALLEQLLEGGGEVEAAAAVEPALAERVPDGEAPGEPVERPERTVGSLSDSTVRVDVELLDHLMNQVGELVLARNRILQVGAQSGDPVLQASVQGLDLITTELQEEVMKTRMQPIGSIWNKFPRAVRDLCVTFGKQVELVMEGRETELDRTLVEAIKDPLIHAIRNAVDHGIETPEARERAGKPATGTVQLRAYHEGGQVGVVLRDDGAGVDPERVARKAVEKGLRTTEEVARMSDGERIQLVFAPGFSTAEAVTNVSGRGVGMDVVRTNIERIGGSVELISELGRWTELRIKIPLTLAIIPALIAGHGNERYAIPQTSLLELLRLGGGPGAGGIETVHGVRVHRLRGQLLPLVHLSEVLGNADPLWPGDPGSEGSSWNVVVLQGEERSFGLVVEEIHDTEEIVVKPLGELIKSLPIFAGATIMGDGSVTLILDVLGIAKDAGVLSGPGAVGADRGSQFEDDALLLDGTTMVLVELGDGDRVALPFSGVSRLEEFRAEQIERCAGREVVQYRDRIMPLVRIDQLVGRPASSSNPEFVQVVVHDDGGAGVGVIVEQIVDILEAEVDGDAERDPESAVIDGRVTEIVSTSRVLAAAP